MAENSHDEPTVNNHLLPTTAAIHPTSYPETLTFATHRTLAAIFLALLIVAGFALRVNQLGVESLSEDELNKLQTVQEYRQNGLTGRNGEHPFLMKGLQTVSVALSERINSAFAASISEEAALRFPVALFGTFTVLLIFFLASELFGRSIGLVSAALWAVEPTAIGFDRLAKEDGLVLFFFLLANLLWIKAQSSSERGERRWFRWTLLSGVAFAGLMASKYYPHLLGVQAAYYIIFQRIPDRQWRMGKSRWLQFMLVMGIAFLIFNPTILLPDTWREMLKFSSESRIGHDSYEYMGSLYRNQMTAWLSGVPWTFYYIFIAVKTTLPTLMFFLIGLAVAFRQRMGDGRFFLFFWGFLWFMPFTFLGGKFTRYFTVVEPLILIIAAIGLCWMMGFARRRLIGSQLIGHWVAATLLAVVIGPPIYNSISIAPHFRLFTNAVGGGTASAGSYFPHDEFYDASTRDIITELTTIAPIGATVACETPGLYDFYADKAGRTDIQFISLSDAARVQQLKAGDIAVDARGRRYFSNMLELQVLASLPPAATTDLGHIPSTKIFKLDDATAAALREVAGK